MLQQCPHKEGQQKEAEVRQEREAREVGGRQERTSARVLQDEAERIMEEKF